MNNRYVRIYTGNGKGKPTAMFGLVLLAVGARLIVYIGQFIKNGEYNEIKTIKNIYPLWNWNNTEQDLF